MNCLIPSLLLCTLTALGAVSETKPAGIIYRLDGTVSLCSAPCASGAPGKKLDKDKDLARVVYSGDILRCGSGGKAQVHTVALIPTVRYKQPPNANDPVSTEDTDLCQGNAKSIAMPDAPTIAENRTSGVEVYESNGFKLGGRHKGADTVIYNPPKDGAVLPGKFILRWSNRPPLGKLTILVQTAQNREIAHLDGVDGATGELDSEAIRGALEGVRDDPASSHGLKIILRADMRADDSTQFDLLSHAEEEKLDRALASVQPSRGLVTHLERAAVFDSFHLYGKVAEEYDAALEEAPMSHDLLLAAYNANTRIGNLHRAHDLLDRVDASEATSN